MVRGKVKKKKKEKEMKRKKRNEERRKDRRVFQYNESFDRLTKLLLGKNQW